ncbi:hypothetical protein RF11_10217 [Thelohanellus kitauei]|uniref:Tc1-like transposase DDE domain-containing protein n=1 Tax=Thelohanellus kitauei TaxID=669202 RepID=A0A0C2MZV8_THEKT|nr:hypothetical protein RF11_10217 [Thelohanellus kitauei]
MDNRKRTLAQNMRNLIINNVYIESKWIKEVSILLDLSESNVRSVVKSLESRCHDNQRNYAKILGYVWRLMGDKNHYTLDDLVGNLGINVHPATHSWSRVITIPNLVVPNSRAGNVSMILAINCLNIVLSVAIIHSGSIAKFLKGFLNSLADIPKRDGCFILVMDNERFHHLRQDFKDSYPFQFDYLPCYSPFLNTCKERRVEGREDLVSRMKSACAQESREELSNYILHSE